MRTQKHLRIVCLKNKESSRTVSERHRLGSLIMGNRNEARTINEDSFQPSLAYLSARLQDQVKSSTINNTMSAREASIKAKYEHSLKTINQIQQAASNMDKTASKEGLEVQKYFQQKQMMIKESKNTMLNLIGSIDFQLNNKKQKQISQAIKSTINQKNTQQKRSSKFNQNKYPIQKNRAFLELDFNNFLVNKQNQKLKFEKRLLEDQQQHHLQKLLVVNPQKTEQLLNNQVMHQPLDLFRFQKIKSKKQNQLRSNSSMGSKPISLDTKNDKKIIQKRMFQKKMFWLRPTLRIDVQDFEWSRLNNVKYNVEVKNS